MARPTAPAPLQPQQLRELEQELRAQRERVAGAVSARLHGHGLDRHEEAGLPRRGDDTDDEGAAEAQRGADVTQLSRSADALASIDAALQRIASGEYGSCIDCGADIGIARLRVQPAASRCSPCQEKAEAAAKQQRPR